MGNKKEKQSFLYLKQQKPRTGKSYVRGFLIYSKYFV